MIPLYCRHSLSVQCITMTFLAAIFAFHVLILLCIMTASMKPISLETSIPAHIFNAITDFTGYSSAKLDLVIAYESRQSSHIAERLITMNIMAEFRNISARNFLDFIETRKVMNGLPLVLIFNPADRITQTLLLSRVSRFYSKYPDQTPMVYFFFVWPMEEQHEKYVVEETLASAIPNAPLHSHLYIVFLENGPNSLALWEFYSVKEIIVFQQIQMTVPTDFMRRVIRRGDFRGMVLNGVFRVESILPINAEIRLSNGSVGVAGESGLAVEAFHLLERSLNFKMHYVAGEGTMTIDKKGQLQGSGRQVYDGEADVLVSFDTEILPFRIEWLAASQPVISHRIQAYYKKMDTSLYRNVLTDAFSLSVWGTVVGSAVLICICFLVLNQCHRKHKHSFSSVEKEPVISTLAVFCQQAWEYPCKNTSTQIVSVVTLIASLLYYTAYAASIVSLLSVEVNPIKDTTDLVDRGYTLYGNKYSMAGMYYITGGDIRHEDIVGRKHVLDFEESISKINSSKSALLNVRYAFMGASLQLNYTLRDVCTWTTHTVLPSEAIQQHGAVFFRKFDPLKKYFDYHLSKWRGSGLLGHYNGLFDQTPSYQCDPPRKQPHELSYADVRGAVNILLVGFVCSVFTLGVEMVIVHFQNEREGSIGSSDKNVVRSSAQKAVRIRKLIERRLHNDALKGLKRSKVITCKSR